jgi:hypothetical protein
MLKLQNAVSAKQAAILAIANAICATAQAGSKTKSERNTVGRLFAHS